MSKILRLTITLLTVLALAGALSACAPEPTATPMPTATPVPAEPTMLTVNDKGLTAADIQGLEQITIIAESKSGDQEYTGARITDVLKLAGATGTTLTQVADDGYTSDVAIADLNENCIVRFRENGGLTTTLPGLPSGTWVKGVITFQVK